MLSEREQQLWDGIERDLAEDPKFAKAWVKAEKDPSGKKARKGRLLVWGGLFLAIVGLGGAMRFSEGDQRPEDISVNTAQAKIEILTNRELLQRLGLCARKLAEKEAWLRARETDDLTTSAEPAADMYSLGEALARRYEVPCEPPDPAEALYSTNIDGMEVVVYPWQMDTPPTVVPTPS